MAKQETEYTEIKEQYVIISDHHISLISHQFFCHQIIVYYTLHANPLAQSPGQVKQDSDKWKLWKNLFE